MIEPHRRGLLFTGLVSLVAGLSAPARALIIVSRDDDSYIVATNTTLVRGTSS